MATTGLAGGAGEVLPLARRRDHTGSRSRYVGGGLADGDAGVCPIQLGGVTIGEVPLILERDQAGGVTVIRQSTGPARGALPEGLRRWRW